MSLLNVILLAAGKGVRMVSDFPKVLHPLLGQPLLFYPLAAVRPLQPKRLIVVVGHQAQGVKRAFAEEKKIQWVIQSPPLGTGHAVLKAWEKNKGMEGRVLILCGDIPLLQTVTLERLIQTGMEKDADLVVTTTHLENPEGYGRIVRNERGEILRIVEEREADPQQKCIKEINAGIYLLKCEYLPLLKKLKKSVVKKEYYLTDLVAEVLREKRKVSTFILKDSDEVLGVNTRNDLARLTRLLQRRINDEWMRRGVTLVDPAAIWIDPRATLAPDVTLFPGVILEGKCQVDKGAVILAHTVVEGSRIGPGARVGPFAHLRPGSVIGEGAHVGNFVETKKTTLGKGAKANHLTYLGDAEIGAGTNIGAGTITCNYDGKKKHPTKIGKNVFVGSDTQFVAPVRIGDGALIGAGTTVTKNVPARALVLSRVEQRNIIRGKKK